MTIVVLLLLAVVWIAVLAPPLLRRGAETRRGDSITDFRRQLGVLQRTGPKVISPAHRRVEHRPAPSAPAASYAVPSAPSARPGAVVNPRSRTLKRRRDVLVGLVGSSLLFLALGAVPALRMMLAVGGASVVLLVAYVALLVRMRNAAAEREMKLTFLPGAVGADGTVVLRRSAN